MRVIQINLDEHYSIIEEWCEKRNFNKIPKILLSETGYMVEDEGVKVCAAWLYPVQGSKLCWIGFPIAETDIDKNLRDEGLDYLFQTLINKAKDMGYELVMTTSDTDPVINRLKFHGFTEGDTKVNQYFARIK